jgi:choloylglycine hydrolase
MKKIIISLGILLVFFISYSSMGCTDFRLTAKDGTVFITRSLEFAQDLQSNLRNSLRERLFTNTTPNGKAGLSWKAKYGYLYIDAMNQDVVSDGINEKGLSFEYLYLPGETQYQNIPSGQEKNAVGYAHFGDWVLGNFQTVDEVRQALTSIYVYSEKIPGLGDIVFPVHAAIYDPSGKSIIVEFIAGKMKIHDNPLGILTNTPTYDWHMTNLRNYINLSPINPKPVVTNGLVFPSMGQGTGMSGLPGDASPPSRFVKATALLLSVQQPLDARGALNLSQHIINNFDIPLGFVRASEHNTMIYDTTQWVVFKDLTHKIFYYRTYNNLNLKSISLDKINFAKDAKVLKMPLAQVEKIEEITEQFNNYK